MVTACTPEGFGGVIFTVFQNNSHKPSIALHIESTLVFTSPQVSMPSRFFALHPCISLAMMHVGEAKRHVDVGLNATSEAKETCPQRKTGRGAAGRAPPSRREEPKRGEPEGACLY